MCPSNDIQSFLKHHIIIQKLEVNQLSPGLVLLVTTQSKSRDRGWITRAGLIIADAGKLKRWGIKILTSTFPQVLSGASSYKGSMGRECGKEHKGGPSDV